MPLRIITGRPALDFALAHRRLIIQDWTMMPNGKPDPRDDIQRFYTGPFDPLAPAGLYYAVKRDEGRKATILYEHAYHRVDWGGAADWFCDLIGVDWEKHNGDFEGGCIIHLDKYDYENEVRGYILTRSHTNIIMKPIHFDDFLPHFQFETKGHGCSPHFPREKLPKHCRVYSTLPLIPLYDETGQYTGEALAMQAQFKRWGIDWPSEFVDRNTQIKRNDGSGYWDDPLGLVERMRRQYP